MIERGRCCIYVWLSIIVLQQILVADDFHGKAGADQRAESSIVSPAGIQATRTEFPPLFAGRTTRLFCSSTWTIISAGRSKNGNRHGGHHGAHEPYLCYWGTHNSILVPITPHTVPEHFAHVHRRLLQHLVKNSGSHHRTKLIKKKKQRDTVIATHCKEIIILVLLSFVINPLGIDPYGRYHLINNRFIGCIRIH